MSSDRKDARAEAAALARGLVRSAWKGTLATLSRDGGHPYASLVAMATEPDGSPLLLLSGLAEHTRNLEADRRASVLVDATSPGRAALTGARLTLVGRIEQTAAPTARDRYLSRHPDASSFIDFADFRLFALRIEWAHLVAGFGRIVRLDAAEVTIPTNSCAELILAENSILDHMNDDHSDAIAMIAAQNLGDAGDSLAEGVHDVGPLWKMVGCDSEGFDLAKGDRALRVLFPAAVTSPDAVRHALVDMVRHARSNSKDN